MKSSLQLAALLLLSATSGGCGGDSGMIDAAVAVPDADGADAGLDVLAPIPPDVPPVAGEGEACRFSAECGPLQVCVSDVCVRAERIDSDEVTWSELRHAPLEEILAANGQRLPRPWAFLWDDGASPRPRSWVVPSRVGAALALTVDHATACPLVVVGSVIRSAWLDDLRCTGIALGEDDDVWVAGLDASSGAPVVVEVDAAGAEIARHDLAEPLDAVIGELTGWRRIAGPITSMLWSDGALFLSMRPGLVGDRSLGNDRIDGIDVVFVRLEPSGSAHLVEVGDEVLFAGHEAGWLVPTAAGAPAALLVQRDVTSLEAPVPLDLMLLTDGSRERWLDDRALDFRPSIRAPGDIAVAVQNHPSCAFTVVRPASRTSSSFNRSACGVGGGYRVTIRPRELDIPEPNLPIALDHPAFGLIRTRYQMVTDAEGVLIELFDRELEPARADLFARSLDAAYENITTQAVSRHRLTVEGALGFFRTGSQFQWFELAISNGAME